MAEAKRYVALIASRSVRDAQMLTSDPNEPDAEYSDDWVDVKRPELYVGIYRGKSYQNVQEAVAKIEGVHSASVRLVEIK